MGNNNRGKSFTGFESRRKFLATAGAFTTGVLTAGCSGGDDGGANGDVDGGDGDGGDGTEQTSTETEAEMQFPQDQITFIVPYGPGGGYDFYTRAVAEVLQTEEIVPVQTKVTNVEGAGGITATNQVWNADPDGHTLMIVNTEAFAVNQIAQSDTAEYDLGEMTALPRVAGTTLSIVVNTDTGITSGDELHDALVNEELKIAWQGPGSTISLMLSSLAALGGTDLTVDAIRNNVVTFDSRSEILTGFKRGDVHVAGGSLSSMRTFVEAGDARFAMLFTEEGSCPDSIENQSCQTLPSLDVDVQNVDKIIAFSGGPYHRIFAGPPDIPDARHQYLCEKITEAIEHPSFEQAAEEADRPILYGDCDLAREGIDQTVQTYQENEDLLRDLGVM